MRVEPYASLYGQVRQDPDPERRAKLAVDGLAALPEDSAVLLSRAALQAAEESQRGALAELALGKMAQGQSEAALAAALGLAGGNAVALAALDQMGSPLATVVREAHWGNSQKAALQVGLEGLAAGAPLQATVLAMAAQGLSGENKDDRSRMAQKGVHALAEQSASCAMGSRALDGMKYRTSARDVAEIALRSSGSTRELARAASAMVDKAYMGEDGGQWSDEKSGVARRCLEYLSEHADRPEERAFAGTVREMLRETRFSQSNVTVAQLAFSALARGDLGERRQAALFQKMVSQALASKDTKGKFCCDKTHVARAGAQALAGSSDPQIARTARLLAAALEPGKFSESNVALAKAGFEAIAAGRGSDADLCRVSRKMIEGSTNSTNTSSKFQADKSTVVRAILPVLRQELPAAEPVFEMFSRAHSGTHFADSYQQNARTMLEFVESGRTSDRQLAALARQMVEGATAGNNSSYAYKDDKTPVALNSARFLSERATDPDVKSNAELLLGAVQDVTFTKTIAAVSEHLFSQAERGKKLSLPREGGELVKKALATENSRGDYHDDKTQVARNVLGLIIASAEPEEKRAAQLIEHAVDMCKYTSSCVQVATEGFSQLGKGHYGLVDLSRKLMKQGHVQADYQDQGPLAAAVVDFAARQEADPETQKALILGRGMLDTGADHRVRVEAAGKLLERWAGGQGLPALETVRWLAGEIKSEPARSEMVEGALRGLAALKQDPDAALMVDQIVGAAPGSEGRCEHLLTGLEAVDKRFKTPEEEAMALLDSVKGRDAAGVHEASEFVLIGGVRLRKDKTTG